jgi:FtsZ-binding cell division protein ZapB
MGNGLFDLAEDPRPMDSKSFETLEVKIVQVLDRLQSVQTERAELQRQVEQLQLKYEDAAKQVEDLTRECDLLKRNQRDVEQEELIRSKINALLAKLEAA